MSGSVVFEREKCGNTTQPRKQSPPKTHRMSGGCSRAKVDKKLLKQVNSLLLSVTKIYVGTSFIALVGADDQIM